jgi:CRISPR/Cas system-associated exonuclease Cas4 (RecB family)
MSRYDMYLSYTGFKKYVSCPQSYYLEYIERKRPKVQDGRNTLNGNAMHNLLEDYINRGEREPEYFIENIDRVWHETMLDCEHIVWRHDDDANNLLRKAREWAVNLADLMEEADLDLAKCESELKADTVVNVNGIRLKMGARLDIVMKNSYNDYVFFDLKASENRAVMEFDQLVWYSIALGAYLGDKSQPKVGGYILPGFKEVKAYHINDKAKDRLMRRLSQVLENIQNKKFDPLPEDKKCYWCDVAFACPVKGALIPHGSGTIQLG